MLDEPQAIDSSVRISNMPFDAIVIKIDAFLSPDDIFNGGQGECKRADYVIISIEKNCILYIEIKRTKDSWEQIVKQLMGAQCVLKYCQEIGRIFWKQKDFLEGYEHRFISIGYTSISKRKTRIEKKAPKHDAPENALKISSPNYLQFNHLAA